MGMAVEISATMVKELREKTGAPMMDCKKALTEASGDFQKAEELLRQKGMASANKKASRATSEGLVVGKVSPDGKRAAMIELNCETDFVARNEKFQALANELSELALSSKSVSADALLEQTLGGGKVSDKITESIATIGENIALRRAAYMEVTGPGCVGLYVHALGGKMGALVAFEASKEVPFDAISGVARDVAMHIVSAKPQFVQKSDVPAEVIENERRIELGKEDLANKPADVREKIVTGRVDKLLAERVLLEQEFVKDPKQKVSQVLKLKEQGVDLKPLNFSLFILGADAGEGEGA